MVEMRRWDEHVALTVSACDSLKLQSIQQIQFQYLSSQFLSILSFAKSNASKTRIIKHKHKLVENI